MKLKYSTFALLALVLSKTPSLFVTNHFLNRLVGHWSTRRQDVESRSRV